MSSIPSIDLIQLRKDIKAWSKSLGFQHVGISDLDLGLHKEFLQKWLANGYQGQMQFFERNKEFRLKPDLLVPGTLRVISVAMRYLPSNAGFADNLDDATSAYISRYAFGKDYHKLMRKRLKQLGEKIQQEVASLNYRPFVDSGPVLEHAFAEKAGIGWTGKHSLSLNHESGSWYFLGELFINLPLPTDSPIDEGCGNCNACISICPTKAIIAPYTIDANRCISYLTIEYDGVIPVEFRAAMGNRIYGCDDCQLICPINQAVPLTEENAFENNYQLRSAKLTTLFDWSEDTFLLRLQGSPIRRIGYIKWRRNLSVAMGNAPYDSDILGALEEALEVEKNAILIEHFTWAAAQQSEKKPQLNTVNRQTMRLSRSIRKGSPRDA